MVKGASMVKPNSTIQYLKDKLLLGTFSAEDRNIGVYMDENADNPSIQKNLLSEIEISQLDESLHHRRAWFERATQAILETQFSGARLEVAIQLLAQQKKNPFSIPLMYRPQRLASKLRERFSTVGEYYESLVEPYAQHIYEDSLSLLLNAAMSLPEELEHEDLTDQEVEFYQNEIKENFLLSLCENPGVTPEENNVLVTQSIRWLRDNQEDTHTDAVCNFIQLRLNQDKVVGYIKSAFDARTGYYGSRFSSVTRRRIADTFRNESRTASTDDEDLPLKNNTPSNTWFTAPEANQQVDFLLSTLDERLTKEQKFLFRMKFVDQYSHEEIAIHLEEEKYSEKKIKASNVNYRVQLLKTDFIKSLKDAGIDDPERILEGLIHFLTGKDPKK